jgi:hypothetical protein
MWFITPETGIVPPRCAMRCGSTAGPMRRTPIAYAIVKVGLFEDDRRPGTGLCFIRPLSSGSMEVLLRVAQVLRPWVRLSWGVAMPTVLSLLKGRFEGGAQCDCIVGAVAMCECCASLAKVAGGDNWWSAPFFEHPSKFVWHCSRFTGVTSGVGDVERHGLPPQAWLSCPTERRGTSSH